MGKPYERKDSFYKKAKESGYRSRASYKLIELDKRLQLFKKGQKVLDLGCFPGGWLQIASEKVGKKGRVLGIDIQNVEPLPLANIKTIKADIFNEDTKNLLLELLDGKADVILSDMSHKLTGTKFADAAESAELVEEALKLAPSLLKPGGTLVAKFFPGEEAESLFEEYRLCYKSLRRLKLKSTRSSSKELYLAAKGFSKAIPKKKITK